MSLRFGYGTNGLTSHRLTDALGLLADLGYDGVALTLDHLHLDPFAPELARRTTEVGKRLADLGLAVVIETGARYLLDPHRKHQPTLMSAPEEVGARLDYLRRAIDVADDLGAEAVSFWSGTPAPELSDQVCWERLEAGVGALLEHAESRGVVLAMEPEPGMFLDSLDGVLGLRSRLGEPDLLRVTLDLGHVVCNEPESMTATIHRAGPLLANVQVDDMVVGVHEHLELGTGEVDFAEALTALSEVDYRGLASLELPRQAHAAPRVAAESLTFLRRASAEGQIHRDPHRIRTLFPAAARTIGRTPGRSATPGEPRVEDEVRVRLLVALADVLPSDELRAEVRSLYRYGDADERRAVLLALHRLPSEDPALLDLVHDALRTNDVRLVAAALGPYAAAHLDQDAWRHGVLKCLFVGVPLALVAGLPERTDEELRAMVRAFADERRAAGRDVPADAAPFLTDDTEEN